MKRAALLLMHQGRSFTQEVATALRRHGLELVGLSSRPASPQAFEESKKHLSDSIVLERNELIDADIESIVDVFRERGYQIVAAVATFEGYRLLMAELNQQLGVADCSPAALRLCLNKHSLRQFLLGRELSAVRCQRVDANEAPRLPAGTWFVKPVRGVASFGAFILRDVGDLADIPRMQQQMKEDLRMGPIFMGEYGFVIEEFVDGPEFSFETVRLAGESHHLCIHEKARLERQARTTLEAMSVSPPTSLDANTLAAGGEFISRCLDALDLPSGAFHIEVKYWVSRSRWEIIEINPRVGGSLINASTEAITRESMVGLWVDTLLAKDGTDAELRRRLQAASQLRLLREGTASRATVFLSKYGDKGRTIRSIQFSPESRRPDILKIHVQPGTELEDSDRAICLMDALWCVEYANLKNEIEFLDQHATGNFHVGYR